MQPAAAAWAAWPQYALDFAQRAVIFWDTLRQRGNNYLEHVQQGQPPRAALRARDGARRAHAASSRSTMRLLRIIPPQGVTVDPQRRPYIIIDPRGGHGPGIGGFKDDSQVGVALRAGHPVYFVIFFRDPEPGQTLLDVCAAEREFVHKVRALHPDSSKPAIVGNCQAGWAAMMLAASQPDETGPLVIVGAPMSYWGGAWRDGEGDNPMRYAGGMLGGTWLASLAADLGNGKFDGAHLVQNFENLNPANTFGRQVLQGVRQRRHRARALPRVRALVGRLLPHEPRGNRVDHAQSLRRQPAVVGRRESGAAAFDLREIRVADHHVRLARRQHHPAAAGVQLGGRRLRLAPRRSRRAARPSSA